MALMIRRGSGIAFLLGAACMWAAQAPWPPAEAEATYWASQPAVEYARKHVPAGAGTN